MKFTYKARTKEGELQVGNVDADTRDAALSVLLNNGLFVLSVIEVKEEKTLSRITDFFKRVKANDLMVFTRQFSTLLTAHVSLSDSLTNLYHQTTNPVLKEAIADIVSDVESGHALSQALEKRGSIFSEFYINMVRSAEVTGRLSEVLNFMADYLETQSALMGKIKNAMFYPIFIIGLFAVILVVMVTVVLPQMAPIFEEAKVKIPFFTQFLLDSGQFLIHWWWALAVVLAMFIFMLIDYFGTHEGKVVRDELVLKIPVVGMLMRKVYIARFAESAKILIKGGLTIPQAIEISSRTIGNNVYQELLHRAADEVRKGRLLNQAIAEMPEFPPLVAQLLAVGESTGQLENLLDKVSAFYTREVNDTVSNLVELIQPAMMVVIGVMVAALFGSILMPMYNMGGGMSGE